MATRFGHGTKRRAFPLGATATLQALDHDPHPILAELRRSEPVSWIPALGGWLVTRYDDARAVMRDADRFTVDNPRFSTAQVLGPSMLSLDGKEHARHRAPFAAPFRPRAVRRTFALGAVDEAARLIAEFEPAGAGELRRGFAGPLAALIVGRALGLDPDEATIVLEWYDAIVGAVTAITAGRPVSADGRRAFAQLRARLLDVADGGPNGSMLVDVATDEELTRAELVSNAGVVLFGGVETTEGMISNALLALLERPGLLDTIRREPNLLPFAIEESMRFEPAAAVVDRYATAVTSLRGVSIAAGDLVRVSIAAANRDPAIFDDPDSFDLHRRNARRHLAFAQGPHVCLGIHLARLEAQTALNQLLARLPRLRLDPACRAPVRGIVFRKPPSLHALWS